MKKPVLFLGGLVLSGMLVLGGCGGADAKEAESDVSTAEETETKTEADAGDEGGKTEEPSDVPADEDVTEEPALAEEPEADPEELLQDTYLQYENIISDLDEKWDQFLFVYFDGDDIPDIFVSSTVPDDNDLKEYLLLTRSRAGAVVIDDLRDGVAGAGGYRGMLYYVTGMGILYERTNDAPLNNPSDYVYLFDDGNLNLYAEGHTEVLDGYEGPDDTEHMVWYWDDQEVTPEEYERNLKRETENLLGDALSTLPYVDRETMLDWLEHPAN